MPLPIVVLVKAVPGAAGDRPFDATNCRRRDATEGLLCELDEYAVKQAVRIADSSVAELATTTLVLAQAVERVGIQLVLCGIAPRTEEGRLSPRCLPSALASRRRRSSATRPWRVGRCRDGGTAILPSNSSKRIAGGCLGER
jgi:hypothetical protein